MPSYITQPASFVNRPLLVPGRPHYVFGGYTSTVSPTLAYVTNVSAVGNTATVTLALLAGAIPTTSQLITVQRCSNSNFNAVGATVTAVSGFNTGDNSIGTVSYTLVGIGGVVSAAATGDAVLPVAETSDAAVNGASQQVTVPFNDPRIDQARTITAQCSFPSLPTTATVTLQGSDDDSTYFDIQAVGSVVAGVLVGGLLSVQNLSYRFYRLNLTNVTGGSSPKIIGKISA